ncbi:PalH-domain-containing protein [Aureobasidium pullulans]|nr:PalH-domain-containing protein [Aureobasidium pullulans]THY81358.1 PalH-domain-containing protein [Aureobasidium pullulans]TIA06655.1 PalH-domain-containing protein [Aureobasidium pullulans]
MSQHVARQLWGLPTTTSSEVTASCTPYTLPSNGILSFAEDNIVTLTANVVFSPACTEGYQTPGSSKDPSSVADLENPFYASTIPQTFVVACATSLAWVLVVMLMINSRSFTPGFGLTNFASGRGLIGGATGGTAAPGVGSRPWLQKVAALLTAIALTIATADTFKVAQEQYEIGYMDGDAMHSRVEGSMEVRVTRVISDVFLWLAQVQTLIRLFPRHKEKVVIKWVGFALIILDTIFSCLNSFLVDSFNRPRHFVDAIPALSYLFELAVGLLYAAWVIFYGLTKRRYAYFHRKMKSIFIVALLSHIAILTPVAFFITDVAQPDVAAWGDYFRWVGAAASSVVVWEWVERIEALERDEKKDGILGREVFDGDEMIDLTPGDNMTYTRKPRDNYRPADHDHDRSGGTTQKTGSQQDGVNRFPSRRRKATPRRSTHLPLGRAHSENRTITFGSLPRPETALTPITNQTPPPPRLSPPDRTNTTSAASTVYVINYGESQEPEPVRRRTEDIPEHPPPDDLEAQTSTALRDEIRYADATMPGGSSRLRQTSNALRNVVQNPFKRKRMSPPAEVRAARHDSDTPGLPSHSYSKWDIKGRIGAIAAEQGEKFRERKQEKSNNIDLPYTVIPAPTRGAAAWSPHAMKHTKSDLSSDGTPSDSQHNTVRDSNSSQHVTWASSTTAGSQGENIINEAVSSRTDDNETPRPGHATLQDTSRSTSSSTPGPAAGNDDERRTPRPI